MGKIGLFGKKKTDSEAQLDNSRNMGSEAKLKQAKKKSSVSDIRQEKLARKARVEKALRRKERIDKLKSLVKTKNFVRGTVAAAVVVAIAGAAVAVNVVAASSHITQVKVTDSSNSFITFKSQDSTAAQNLFTFSDDLSDTQRKYILWTLSSNSMYKADVASFASSAGNADAIVRYGFTDDDLTSLDTDNPTNIASTYASAPALYYRHAGVAKLTIQPRDVAVDVNGVKSWKTEGSSASIDVISPLLINNVEADYPASLTEDENHVSLSGMIDSGTNPYLKFYTNAEISNLNIKIDGEAAQIHTATDTAIDKTGGLEGVWYATDTDKIYISTTSLAAGSHTITFETNDIGDASSAAEKAFLSMTKTIIIKPRVTGTVTKLDNATKLTTAVGTDGGWYYVESEKMYYYIFSEKDLHDGKDTVDLFAISNVEAESSTVGFGFLVGADQKVIDAAKYTADGTIKANQAGVTTVYVSGSKTDVSGATYGDYGFNIKVVVPFTYIGDDITLIKMNVNNQFYFNTTGGDGITFSSQNDIPAVGTTTSTSTAGLVMSVDPKTRYGEAVAAGTSDVVVAFTKTYVEADKEILNKLYGSGYDSTTVTMNLNYHFQVIDDFVLNTTNVTIGTGESFDLVASVTYFDDKTAPVKWTYEDYLDDQKNVITPRGDVTYEESNNGRSTYTTTITGKTAGYMVVKATQTIDGVIKTQQCIVTITQSTENLTISVEKDIIYKGDSNILVTATFKPEMATNKSIKEWVSTDDSIVKLTPVTGTSDRAYLEAVGGGTAYICAISTDGTRSAYVAVTVYVPITDIKFTNVENDSVTGKMADKQFQLVTKVTYSDGGDYGTDGVTYKSYNESVATVSSSGLVTYVSPGHATIIAQIYDINGWHEAMCNFTIEVPVESIELDKTEATIAVGDKLSLKAVIKPGDATDQVVSWESSDPSVATVEYVENSTDSVNAVVTGQGHGNVAIYCYSADGTIHAVCNIYVKREVEELQLSVGDEIDIRKGATYTLNLTIIPASADDKEVTWTSDHPEWCSVDSNGTITGVSPTPTDPEEYAIITVSLNSNPTKYTSVKVRVLQAVEGLELNEYSQELTIDPRYGVYTTFAILPNVLPVDATNRNCTFTSSNTDVITVDENGIVTPVKGGNAVVIVKTEEGGFQQQCSFTVKEYVTSVTLSSNELYIGTNKTGKLMATIETETASNRNIEWSISDGGENLVMLEWSGNQCNILAGGTTGDLVVTATAADGSGEVDTCIVHVVQQATSLSIDPSYVHMLRGESYVLNAVIEPSNATLKDVEWSSSNPTVADVDEGGEVYALAIGNATITATAKDGSGLKATAKIRVTEPINITSLTISSSDIYMLVGKQRQLSLRVRPASNTDSYDWYSTDTGIVTVDSSGVITTVGPGSADVVVESGNTGVSSSCTVHALAISDSTMRLEQYDSNDLYILGNDSGTVTWKSSNPRIATVDSSGQVVGRMSGTCTITATVHDKTLSCVVTVFTAKKYN